MSTLRPDGVERRVFQPCFVILLISLGRGKKILIRFRVADRLMDLVCVVLGNVPLVITGRGGVNLNYNKTDFT